MLASGIAYDYLIITLILKAFTRHSPWTYIHSARPITPGTLSLSRTQARSPFQRANRRSVTCSVSPHDRPMDGRRQNHRPSIKIENIKITGNAAYGRSF